MFLGHWRYSRDSRIVFPSNQRPVLQKERTRVTLAEPASIASRKRDNAAGPHIQFTMLSVTSNTMRADCHRSKRGKYSPRSKGRQSSEKTRLARSSTHELQNILRNHPFRA
jgi:hypothetical protein